MEKYRRKVFLDNDDYIIKYKLPSDGKDEYDLTIEILHSERLNCWKLQNGRFVYDEVKANEQIRIENLQKELAELKQKLKDSDYYKVVVEEGDRPEEYYNDLVADRHTWRLRAREIEKELKELGLYL